MNQLEQLEVYLKHLGRPYVIKDADPKAFNKIPYTDENGKDNEVEYTKVVTIDSPESVKDYYPKIDLWYIPSLDKFVEHGSATDGETNALQADTAKDILDYIGYVYWEMEDLGDQLDNSPKNTEKRLNNSKKESSMKTYECSMQKKIESLAKKRSEAHANESGDELRYTNEELRRMAKEKLDKLLPLINGETITADFLRRLSKEIPQKELGVDGFEIEANGYPFYSYGRKIGGADKGGWDEDPNTLEFFRIEEYTGLLGYIYFNVKNGKAKISGFDIFNMYKDDDGSWQWEYEADAENDNVQYSELTRTAKKSSEKRTVTKSYDVYKYDELSDDAKAKVKDLFLQWRGEDGDIFKEDCENSLAEMFPNSDLKVQYSLTYSQGDGFNTYGTLNIKDLLNADFSKYPLNDSGITAPANKDAILAACDKADVYDIDLEENRRYGYSLADRLEVVPNNDEDLTDEDTALLSDLENFAREVMEAINSKFEKNGYDYFYEMDEEEVRDMADANDYEFTEDGELA